MWYAIIGALLAVFAGGLVYISFRAANLPLARRIAGERRAVRRLACFAAFSALFGLIWAAWNAINALVCLAHLALFWAACDLVSLAVARLRGRRPARYRAGAAAMALCAAYLAAGWFAAHHVRVTTYALESPKLDARVRIVQLTDVHLGATFHADGFARHIEAINALSPDVVVVTGDFVDDDTSRADMLGGCDALGQLRARHDVFFVYGNHDMGYGREAARGWTNAEMRARLDANGVHVLEDAWLPVGDALCIAGRRDRSEAQRGRSRMTAAALLEGVDRERYIVLLDHQPADFDAEAAAGADLVLCGHTHGGQLIPINHVGEWIGENCLRYGHERRLDTDFIVSSGISNWALRFKTGCHSEYVVIDVAPGQAH